jgi:hypothetical protein
MVTAPEAHDVAVLPPWYAPSPRKVAIHRYLDAGFVAQFQADAGNAPERNSALFGWEQEDRMGPDQGNLLKLRRPVHRTFHVVVWEASCKISTAPSGQPPLAAEKIESAGFVLRTGDPSAPQGFQLVRGKPQGWSAVEPGVDPDATRQVQALGVLLPQPASPISAYTGEETFPLHPLSVQDGTTTHTLLFGYLPIGGGDYVPPSAATPPAPDTSNFPEDLSWPFGLFDRSNGPPPLYTYDQQIARGQIISQFGALLRVLLGRYQFVEPAAWSDPANAAIVGILDTLHFYTTPAQALSGQALRDWAAARPVPGLTLGSVLRDPTAAQDLLTALMKAAPTDRVPLPATAHVPMGADNLLVIESVAAQIRATMRLRLAQAIAISTAAMPVPKLASGPSGRYFLVPFVRTVKPDGCPRISWGAPSEPFAVAAAFDPDAARPSLIEMPGLADARKGLARGAMLDMPPDLANLANSLSNNAAVQAMWTGNGSAPGGGGIRFICSFSLPVISICAMVMLSIVISLLNIFLGWMAWVKICLPVPSKK